jgi:hypothetical protein
VASGSLQNKEPISFDCACGNCNKRIRISQYVETKKVRFDIFSKLQSNPNPESLILSKEQIKELVTWLGV